MPTDGLSSRAQAHSQEAGGAELMSTRPWTCSLRSAIMTRSPSFALLTMIAYAFLQHRRLAPHKQIPKSANPAGRKELQRKFLQKIASGSVSTRRKERETPRC